MRTLLFALGLFIANTTIGQPSYQISYRHCFQSDTTRVLTDTIGKMALLTGNSQASNYVLNKIQSIKSDTSKLTTTSFAEGITDAKAKGKTTGSFTVKLGKPFDNLGDMVFFDKKNDSIFLREKMLSEYVLTNELAPVIQWKIDPTQKRFILKYECIKATCSFRGRNYTAWYAPTIPIADGPWKFKGLPGLILYLEDDNYLLKIYADRIMYPSSEPVPVFQPVGKKIPLAKYFDYKNSEIREIDKADEMLLQSQPFYGQGERPRAFKDINRFFLIELRMD